jgi:DNA/RNA endonuclease YhcR with UshA esterase domain
MKRFAILAIVATLALAALAVRAAETNSVLPTISAFQVTNWIGKQVTVTGTVTQVSVRPSITFLNFEKRYPNSPFAAVIHSQYTNEFENLPVLKGKAVAVTGQIKEYNGKPEMELTRKTQLKLLSESK